MGNLIVISFDLKKFKYIFSFEIASSVIRELVVIQISELAEKYYLVILSNTFLTRFLTTGL